MTSFISENISIYKAIKSQTHIRNLSMWNPIMHQKSSHPSMATNVSSIARKSYYKQGINFIHIYQRIKQTTCMFMWMHDLPYLPCNISTPMASWMGMWILLGLVLLNPIIRCYVCYYVWHYVWLNVVINKISLLLSKIMVTWIFGYYHIVHKMHSMWFMWFIYRRYRSQVLCKLKILVRSRSWNWAFYLRRL